MGKDMRWLYSGGAIIPIAARDEGNAMLGQQGYGDDNFTLEMESNGTVSSGQVTHAGCYMPMDSALRSAVDAVLDALGGEWVTEPKMGSPMSVGEQLNVFVAELLKKRLVIKSRKRKGKKLR